MRKSVYHGIGYLLCDDRGSGGKVDEADMLSCFHCQGLLRKKSWQEDGGFCHCCDGPICGPCADRMLTQGCENFLRRLLGALEHDYRRSQNAKVLGI